MPLAFIISLIQLKTQGKKYVLKLSFSYVPRAAVVHVMAGTHQGSEITKYKNIQMHSSHLHTPVRKNAKYD